MTFLDLAGKRISYGGVRCVKYVWSVPTIPHPLVPLCYVIESGEIYQITKGGGILIIFANQK